MRIAGDCDQGRAGEYFGGGGDRGGGEEAGSRTRNQSGAHGRCFGGGMGGHGGRGGAAGQLLALLSISRAGLAIVRHNDRACSLTPLSKPYMTI